MSLSNKRKRGRPPSFSLMLERANIAEWFEERVNEGGHSPVLDAEYFLFSAGTTDKSQQTDENFLSFRKALKKRRAKGKRELSALRAHAKRMSKISGSLFYDPTSN